MRRQVGTAILTLTIASPVWADRAQIYSVQGFTCDDCEDEVKPVLKKVKGLKKWSFDRKTYEYTITLADNVPDQAVVDAFKSHGFRAIVGPGHGAGPEAYKPEPYPDGADVVFVTKTGEAVGALERFRVDGKFTVLDFYADWCGPCRDVDRQLHGILTGRDDLAIRKFNVVDFDSPLARELGPKLTKLPYVVVFDPKGRRTEITGEAPKKLADALSSHR